MQPQHRPLAALSSELRSGARHPSALATEMCDRLDAVESDVQAFLPETGRRDRLAREADALDARYDDPSRRPPLFGIPVGVKDIFNVDGFPTKAGSGVPASALTGPESTAVERLRDAGALVVGKTQTTEFAYFEPAPTRNPNDLDHTPGGSSSGSAAAVAAGTCSLALGSQTVGSVVRPAAFCGVVGFKPSYDRIPIGGVIPLAPSVDHVGAFTPDVPGMARAAGILCDGWDPVDRAGTPIVGVPEGPYLDQTSDVGLRGFEAAIDALAEAGIETRRVPMLDHVDEVNERHNRLVAAEAALAHSTWRDAHEDGYAEETLALIDEGRGVGVDELVDARVGRLRFRERVRERVSDAGVDLLVCPAAPGPAPEGIDTTGDPTMNLPWTHGGVPALTVPSGRVGALPLGLQCVAPYGADESLLAWGETLADAVSGLGDVA